MKYFSVHKVKCYLIILFSFVIFISLRQSQPKDVIYIPYGGDTDAFIIKLKHEGYISNTFSELILRVVLAMRGGIEPGGYTFSKGMGAVATVIALDKPTYQYISIFDGYRTGQIAQAIGTKLEWSDDKVNKFAEVLPLCPLNGEEGYLASGTYLIHVQEDTKIVKQTMQQSFSQIITDLGLDEKNVSIPEVITIASLIQREAGGKADMRLISGIIHKRLEIGMPLQIDATLQYIKGSPDNWWPVPTSKDKFIDSPFNTYQHDGLPPSPIATPSKAAIVAALNPMSTDCLFYLHDSHRTIHCSTNYEQHKKNIQYYLK